TLDWVDSGWWNSTGSHDQSNDNYITGQTLGNQYHDFFVFNLAGVHELIVGAQLRLTNPLYSSPDATETYSVFDVSTPIAALSARGSGRTDIFTDLGTGSDFGSQTVSSADNGQVVTVNLSPAALARLNAAAGGQVALGGALTTLAGSVDQFLFGFSG